MKDSQCVGPLELSTYYYLFCRSSLCEKAKLFIATAAVSILNLVITLGMAVAGLLEEFTLCGGCCREMGHEFVC
jgi:hypothetical protein